MKNNMILLMLSLVISLAVCEAAARALLYVRTPEGMVFDRDIIYTYEPHAPCRGERLNDIGCIGDDVAMPKKKGEIRVFLLGGSTSFYFDYADTVRRHLSQRCQGRTVKVISCGKPRYTSYINLVNLKKNLLQYDPDVIVLYMGINDNIYNTFPWTDDLPDVGFFNWRSLSRSLFVTLIQYYLVDKNIRSNPDFSLQELRSAEKFRSNVKAIIDTAEQHTIKTVLATFAVAYPTQDKKLLEHLRSEEEEMEHFWGRIPSTALGVREHNRIMLELARKHGLPVARVDEALPGTSEFFIDMCHFTHRGKAAFGSCIAEAIPVCRD